MQSAVLGDSRESIPFLQLRNFSCYGGVVLRVDPRNVQERGELLAAAELLQKQVLVPPNSMDRDVLQQSGSVFFRNVQ